MPHSSSSTAHPQQQQVVLLTKSLEKKAEEINLVLLQPQVDLWKLRGLALSEGGLVNGACFVCVFGVCVYS